MSLAVVAQVLVVERVLARHERRPVQVGRRAAPGDRGDELAERRSPAGVAPGEVVEQGHPIGVGADGDHVADRLVDDGDRHVLRVAQPVPRIHADPDGEAFGRRRLGDHDTVAWRIRVHADQRPHDGRTEDLVVVPADDRFLRGDVRMTEQRHEGGDRVGDRA